jgi:hypothetical protein
VSARHGTWTTWALSAAQRPPLGRGQSGPDSAGPEGRTPGSSLSRGGPDASPAHRTRVVGRGSKRHRAVQEGESPSGRVVVAQASWNSFASAAGPGHASRWRRRLSKSQQGSTQLRSQSIAGDSEASRDRQHWPLPKPGPEKEAQQQAARGMSPRIFTPLCHIGKV